MDREAEAGVEQPSSPVDGELAPPFLDTNIILRYLIGDIPQLAAAARTLIDGDNPVCVSAVILAEVAHVLRSFYGISRNMIADGLVDLVRKQNVTPYALDRDLLVHALGFCRETGRVSIPDALLWAEARSSGAGAVYSFDEQFPTEGITILRDAHPAPTP